MHSRLMAGDSTEKQLAYTHSLIRYSDLDFSKMTWTVSLREVDQHGLIGISAETWVTPNLQLCGTLEPVLYGNDPKLYFNIGLGYLPTWNWQGASAPLIGFGMHRMRFASQGDSRWYHISLTSVNKWRDIDFNIGLIRLFDVQWNHYQVLFGINHTVTENIRIHFGLTAQKTNQVDLNPGLRVVFGL